MSALNWRWIFDDASGLINNVLVRLELIDETISWLSEPQSRHALRDRGGGLAGHALFHHELPRGPAGYSQGALRAAEIDGASVLQQFTHITLPRLRPIFITALMLSAILTSAAIQFVLVLTNGGPADRTMIFRCWPYHLALGGAHVWGWGAAVSLVFFPILVVFIVFLTRRMLREKGGD
jgi:multiple sugar transport system permease protein